MIRTVLEERTTVTTISDTHRDSGTSSPIHPESTDSGHSSKFLARHETQLTSFTIKSNSTMPLKSTSFDRQTVRSDETEEELSDSNDSVFSSGSSIDSILNYNSQDHEDPESFDLRDIYLGGSCALRSNWRNEIISIINEHDITYHMPQMHDSLLHSHGDSDAQLSTSPPAQNDPSSSKPLETSSSNDSGIGTGQPRHRTTDGAALYPSGKRLFHLNLLEASRVLLFVISNETRALAPMTLAAHCIGLGYNVVLCVQKLTNDCVIGDDQVNIFSMKLTFHK